MKKNIPLLVSSIAFSLLALIHLLRIIFNWPVVISGTAVSMKVSYMGFFVALILSGWMLWASRK